MSTTHHMDAPTVRAVSVVAEVDPRTVRRYLDGEPVRPSSRRRLDRAVAELGLAIPSASGEVRQ